MEKLAENDLTYFYLRHVVIVVTAVYHNQFTASDNVSINCLGYYATGFISSKWKNRI